MGLKWSGLITLPIFLASQGAWAACTNTITVKDGAGVSQTFCRGTDGTNFENAHVIMDPVGANFAAVNAASALLVAPSPVTVANNPMISSISNWSGLPNPVSVTLVSGLPNPVTVTGTVAVSNFPNPLTVTGTFTASSNVWLINSAGTQIATAANPVSTVGAVTVNNSPLVSSISNWSGFPNPVTVVGTLIQQDATAFTPTTTSFGIGGGFFQSTPTNNTLANLQMGGFQVTNSRALFTNLRNSAATEIGTAANPVSTAGPVTVNNASLTVSVSNIATSVTVNNNPLGTSITNWSGFPNPATVAGTITVNNSPLISSISNWSGFPNPISASVQGFAANAAAAAGNPVQIGGVAQTAEPTATTTGQATAALYAVTGKAIVEPWSLPQSRAYGSVSTGSTTAVTVIAAPGASVRLYGWIECGRTDAGTAAVTVTLNDVAGTILVIPNTSGGGGNNYAPPIPLQWGINSAITIAVSTATTTMICNAQAFKSAI